jgi:adenylate cyclase
MGGYHLMSGQHDRAIAAYQRAQELNPNDADVMTDFGFCLSCAGRAKEAVEMVRKAMQLNPHYPAFWLVLLGPIYFDARRYEDAIATLESLQTMDTIVVQVYRAASHAALGDTDQARAAVTRVFGFDQKATIRSLAPVFLNLYREADDREHLRVNLLKAGLPE